MADAVQPQAQPATDAKAQEPSIDEKIASAIAEQEKKFKSEINGLNRRNSELEKLAAEREKALEAERTAHMSEKEKAQHEIEKQKEEALRYIEEGKKAKWEMMILKGLSDSKLGSEVMQLMTPPTDEESLSKWISTLNSYVKNSADARVNANLLANAPNPKAGDGVQQGLMTRAELDAVTSAQINSMPKAERASFMERVNRSAAALQARGE